MSKKPFEEAIEDDLEGEPAAEPVVRLNRKTVAMVVGGLVILFAGGMLWGTQPERTQPAQREGREVKAAVRPMALEALPASYGDVDLDADLAPFRRPAPVPDASLLTDPQASAASPRAATRRAPEAEPAAAVETNAAEKARLEELAARMEAMLAAAAKADEQANASPILFARSSSSGVSGLIDQATSGGGPFEFNDSRGLGTIPSPPDATAAVPADVRSNLQAEKKAFTEQGSQAGLGVLDQRLVPPASPYLLQAGHSIGGALITAINTDLPGRIVAQTTESVFDSITGQHLLIPAGSRLLGSYDSLVSNGQDRALIVWERLILPNGESMILDAMLGVDATGAAGKRDQVDWHFDRLALGVLLSTAISFTANAAQSSDDSGDDVDLLGESIAQQSASIGSRVVDRILEIQPTIKVRQGARVRVLVEQDMVLRPYSF